MLSNSKILTVIDELRVKLQCSELAESLERVNEARVLLAQLQQNDIFQTVHSKPSYTNMSKQVLLKASDLLMAAKHRLSTVPLVLSSSSCTANEESVYTLEDLDSPKEEYEIEEYCECEDFSADTWLGFFKGYDIVEEKQEREILIESPYKLCIELSLKDDCGSLECYLRSGIRCFMIDLFLGTVLDKQKLIYQLRESELKVSKEYGVPLGTTLFALLSPRLQYTGIMTAENPTETLTKGSSIILTTKRKYSVSCNSFKFYVNARFLLDDCKEGDFILVGPSIQLAVTEPLSDTLKCVVVEPGLLSSRLPVRFPARCYRSQVSLEELEDIIFAHEVGINVLVSYKPESRQYLKDLKRDLSLLNYDNLRLFTRLVLSDYETEDIEDIEWIAESYEGFLAEIDYQQHNNCCQIEDDSLFQGPNILEFSPSCKNFVQKLFNQKKPIIFNPRLIAERQLCVPPHNVAQIFQYPDKLMFSKESFKNAFSFFLLQNALTEDMPPVQLPIQSFCETSAEGDDQLARACVAVSYQSQVKAIVVCSVWPDMSIKISHYRPEVPILFVSATKSVSDYITLYHHLRFLHFQGRMESNHVEYVRNAFIFSLICLKNQNMLHDGQSVLLVYASETMTKFCNNHLIFKFNEYNFASNLQDTLFP